MNACNLVRSKRGAHMLIVDGFSYHLNKKINDKYYWRCTRNSSSGCGVSVITLLHPHGHTIVSQNHDHVHLSEPEKLLEMNYKSKLKDIAVNSMDSPSQIINRCLKDVPSVSAPTLPNKTACANH